LAEPCNCLEVVEIAQFRYIICPTRLQYKDAKMLTYKEFRSAFTKPKQRKDFLLHCAQQGLQAIVKEWPEYNVRLFVFGSTAKEPINIGSDSDLDIAVSGLNDIAPKSYQRNAMIRDIFRKGLSAENCLLPIDVLTFDAENPETMFAKEILKNAIEIKLEC